MKLMDLEEGVKIAKIAKVREKVTDGESGTEEAEDKPEAQIPENQ